MQVVLKNASFRIVTIIRMVALSAAILLTIGDHQQALGGKNVDPVVVEIGGTCSPWPEGEPRPYQATGKLRSGVWSADAEIVHKRGLVLKNIVAEGVLVLRELSVPRFEILGGSACSGRSDPCIGSAHHRVVRFCEADDKSFLDYRPGDRLTWGFTKEFDEEGLRGKLDIRYEYIFRQEGLDPVGPQLPPGFSVPPGLPPPTGRVYNPELEKPRPGRCEVAGRECHRFIPTVRFEWRGETPARLSNFEAFYRFDYGPAGMTLTRDGDDFAGVVQTFGMPDIVRNETAFTMVIEGRGGPVDNFHPVYPIDGRRNVFIPGCRNLKFDCLHIHTRWSKFSGGYGIPAIDPMVDPLTGVQVPEPKRGTPYLVEDQTIRVALVKAYENEKNPTGDPFDQVNGEQIATVVDNPERVIIGPFTYDTPIFTKSLSFAEEIAVWYAASRHDANADTFFRHGFYVLRPGEVVKNLVRKQLFYSVFQLGGSFLDLLRRMLEVPAGREPTLAMLDLGEEGFRNQFIAPGPYGTFRPETGDQVYVTLAAATDALLRERQAQPELAATIDLLVAHTLILLRGVTVGAIVRGYDRLDFAAGAQGAVSAEARQLLQFATDDVRATSSLLETPTQAPEVIRLLRSAWQNTVAATARVTPDMAQFDPPL